MSRATPRWTWLGLSLLGCTPRESSPLDSEPPQAEGCTTDGWAGLNRAYAWFVDDDAVFEEPPDGSEARPFRTIQEGVDAAAADPDRKLVLVYAGDYPENISLNGADPYSNSRDHVILVGQCRKFVRITGAANEGNTPTVLFGGRAQSMRHFTIAPEQPYSHDGVRASEGTISLQELSITGPEITDVNHHFRGLTIDSGADVTATDISIKNTRGAGILVFGSGTSLEAANLEVSDVHEFGPDSISFGVSVDSGAFADLSDVNVSGEAAYGLYAHGARTTVFVQSFEFIDIYSNHWTAGIVATDAATITNNATLSHERSAISGTDIGVFSTDASTVDLTRVDMYDLRHSGVLASNSAINLEDSSISGVKRTADGSGGFGILIGEGSDLGLDGVTVNDNEYIGLDAESGTHVRITDSTFIRNTYRSIQALQSGTTIVMATSSISGTMAPPDLQFEDVPAGLVFADGVVAIMDTVDVTRNVGVGVSVRDSELEMRHVHIVDTVKDEGRGITHGLAVDTGSRVSLYDTVIERNEGVGVFGLGPDSEILGEDILLRDNELAGVELQHGITFELEDATLEDNLGIGIVAFDSPTTITLADVLIQNHRRAPDTDRSGRAINLQCGPTLTATNLYIEQDQDVGLYASSAVNCMQTTVHIEGFEIRDTQPKSDGSSGRGFFIGENTMATMTGGIVESNRELGGMVNGAGAMLTLQDVDVLQTQRSTGMTFAAGVLAQNDALLTARSVRVTSTEGLGFLLRSGASLDGHQVTMSDNQGANIALIDASGLVQASELGGVEPTPEGVGGVGVFTAASATGSASLWLDDVAVLDAPVSSVWLEGPGDFRIMQSRLSTSSDGNLPPLHGNGVVAKDGVTARRGDLGLSLQTTDLSQTFGTDLLLHASSASLGDGNTWSAEGYSVVQQLCEGLADVPPVGIEGASTSSICPSTEENVANIEFNFDFAVPTPLH